MFLKSYLVLGVATCLLTALAHASGWHTPSVFSGGGSSYGGHGYGSSSRSSGGYFSGWGGGK